MNHKFMIFFTCLFISITGFPQDLAPENVPSAVRQSFSKSFPVAKNVRYTRQDQGYKVGFLWAEKQCFATLDKSGKLVETEKGIDASELPKEVKASVNRNFGGYAIIDAVRREAVDMGICYEMDLKKDRSGYQVRFSPKGEILLKVARKEEIKVITKPR